MAVGGALAMACHGAPPAPPPPPPVVTVVRDSVIPPPRRARPDTALRSAERDAIVREAQTRRAAWRALGIEDYQIRVAAGCFCPWPQTPAILVVRNRVAAELRDTTGRRFGALREPWSIYTVEGLFDLVEQAARGNDMLEVTYNARFGYPTSIRGDARWGLPDDWFWVRATELTPRR